MPKTGRALAALAAAAIVLVIAAWYDAAFLAEAELRAKASFELGKEMFFVSLGGFAVAGTVLLLAWLARSSRSRVVGVIYLVVGAFFALLPWIFTTFALYGTDVPPLLPEPLARVVGDIYLATVGPLNAVVVIGAGMVIGGLAAIAGSRHERSWSSSSW